MATTDMETFRGQDVEGAFDIIVYIGEYSINNMPLSVIGVLILGLVNRNFSQEIFLCAVFSKG